MENDIVGSSKSLDEARKKWRLDRLNTDYTELI